VPNPVLSYPLKLTRDDDGTLLVTCPDLPEVTSFGETRDEALRMGAAAVEEAIAARLDDLAEIPLPSAAGEAHLSLQLALKALLWRSLMEAGVTRADLQRRLGWHRPQVDRLFDPNHATRTDRFDLAFGALGLRVGVALDAA
jgi:antitoxin HicB